MEEEEDDQYFNSSYGFRIWGCGPAMTMMMMMMRNDAASASVE
jgi:hypothetical protein